MLMPMLLAAVLLAQPDATDGPRRDELDSEVRIAVEANNVSVRLQFTSHANRRLCFTLPAGLPFQPIGREAPAVLTVEPATVDIPPRGTLTHSIPAVPLKPSDRLAGPATAEVTDALGPAVRLVATIHELSQAGKLRSPLTTVAQSALQLPPVGQSDLADVKQQVSQEVWKEIESSLAAAFPVDVPVPPKDSATAGSSQTSQAGRWYSHGQGDYRFRIPEGWTLVPGHRNREPDKDFDTLHSPDRRYVIVCSRNARAVGEAGPALAAYRDGQMPEVIGFDQVTLAGCKFDCAPALRIGYVVAKSEIAIWRMAIVHGERRYVINAIAPAAEYGDELPPSMARALGSLKFDSERE